MNGLGERTEESMNAEKPTVIPARVQVNEGDAWYVNSLDDSWLRLVLNALSAHSCTVTVQNKSVWTLLTLTHMALLRLSSTVPFSA